MSVSPIPVWTSDWTTVAWDQHVERVFDGARVINFIDIGEGPLVLLVHGLGGSWQSWLENILVLAREFRVVAVDLPGFGESTRLPEGRLFPMYGDALRAVIDRIGADSAHVVGHSFGGLVSQSFAVSHPDRVRTLTLVDAGGVPLAGLRLAVIMGAMRVVRLLLSSRRLSLVIARNGPLRRALLRPMVKDPRRISREFALQTLPRMATTGFLDAVRLGSEAVMLARPEEVSVPTMVMWGDADRLLPPWIAADIRSRLPDGQVRLFDAGHCPMFEEPVTFNQVLVEFLRGAPEDLSEDVDSDRVG